MQIYDRWCRLRVGEVMSPPSATVSKNETLAAAAEKMSTERQDALLVLDEAERCVGILTGADMARSLAQNTAGQDLVLTMHAASASERGQPGLPSSLGPELVSQRMSSALQTTLAEDTLAHATRVMCLEKIHHLPVLDARGRAVGILSALDLLKAMLQVGGDEG